MPFRSQAQRAFMYAKHPKLAKRWEKETPPGKLPAKVGEDMVETDQDGTVKIKLSPGLFDEFVALEVDTHDPSTAGVGRTAFVGAMEKARKTRVLVLDKDGLDYLVQDSLPHVIDIIDGNVQDAYDRAERAKQSSMLRAAKNLQAKAKALHGQPHGQTVASEGRTAEALVREIDQIQSEMTAAANVATVAVPLGGVAPGAGGGSIAPWGDVDSKKDKEKFFKRFNRKLAQGKQPQRESAEEPTTPMMRRPFPAESDAEPIPDSDEQPYAKLGEEFDYLWTNWPGKEQQLGPELDYADWLDRKRSEADRIESISKAVRSK